MKLLSHRCLAFIVGILGILQLQAFSPLSQIQVTQDKVLLQLPGGLLFQVSAQSAAGITKVTLRYGTNARSCQSGTARHTLEIEPGREVQAEWEWKFRRSGVLPPGAELWWQWEIEDAAGNTLETERRTLVIQDQRQDWRQVERRGITVQWYSGGSAFAQEVLSIAVDSLERLSQEMEMELPPDQPVWITVYPNSEEIREALIHSTEWTGGVTLTEYSSILIAASPGETEWVEDVIPHELAHILVSEITFNCRGGWLPTWLSEGLAVYAEGPVSEFDQSIVTDALENGDLPPLASLESGFSAYAEEASLAYAQSAVMVEFMIEQYGADKMSALLAGIREGETISEALTQVYGLDTQGIDNAWRVSLGYQSQAPAEANPAQKATPTRVPTLALWTSVAGLANTPTSPPASTQTATPLPAQASSTPAPALPTPSPTAMPGSDPADNSSPWLWVILLAALIVGGGLIVIRTISRRR